MRRKFLWGGMGHNKKSYSLIVWDQLCTDKKQGGLGVSQIEQMNTTLLAKW